MATKQLSDAGARNAKAKAKPYKLAAGGGLYLEIMPTGKKYWRMKYRFAGREKRLAFGVYPEVPLKEAGDERDKARALLRAGRDPGAEKQAAKLRSKLAADNSFENVAREWLNVKKHGWTERQYGKELDRLENHAFPWIGRLPIADIGVAELKPILARVVKAGHVDQAHRLQQQLSRVFRYAVAQELTERDPAADLRDTLPTHTKKNFATILEPAKVGELLRVIDGFSGTFPVACALRLSPLLFARPGEIRAAEWTEIDLDHKDGARWAIQPPRRKLRKVDKENPNTPPHIVPLCRQAVAILRELQPLTGTGRYLFPGARATAKPMSENTINAALRRMGYDKTAMTGHGFRHMASTLLNELGWNKDAIERQLSHKEPGVGGVYNKAEHLPERRRMMQAWADYLDKIKAGGEIVPFRKKSGASR